MKFLRLALVSVCALTSFIGCDQAPPETVKTYRPVQYTTVQLSGGEFKQTFSGTIEAGLDADLSFRVNGSIVKRPIKLGQKVDAQALLMELDNTTYKVAVQQAQANLQQAVANARNQKANYERVIDLYENNNASKSDLDAARAGTESASAAVAVAEKQLEAANLQLSYTRLVSPQPCSIAAVLADTNETVQAGQPVVRVNCGDCPKVAVSVPEQFIQSIKTGQAVQVAVNTTGLKRFEAQVSEVGVAAATGGTFKVEALLQGQCPDLPTGMSANVTFDLANRFPELGKQQIFIPYLSVGQDQKGHFVFVLVPTEGEIFRAERRSVTIGKEALNGLQILSGLEPGDRIATAGVRRLLDGMEVKLLEKPLLGDTQ